MRILLSLAFCLLLFGSASADERGAISLRRPCPDCQPCQPDQDCHPLKLLHPQPRPDDDDRPFIRPPQPSPHFEPAKDDDNTALILALALAPVGLVLFGLVSGGTYVAVRKSQERGDD